MIYCNFKTAVFLWLFKGSHFQVDCESFILTLLWAIETEHYVVQHKLGIVNLGKYDASFGIISVEDWWHLYSLVLCNLELDILAPVNHPGQGYLETIWESALYK